MFQLVESLRELEKSEGMSVFCSLKNSSKNSSIYSSKNSSKNSSKKFVKKICQKLYKEEDVPAAAGIITGIVKIRGYVCFLLVYCQGAFTNYVDKTRQVCGTENINGIQIFPLVYFGKKIPSQMSTGGGQVVNNGQNLFQRYF